jgi:hypothetical protein
MGSVAVSLNIPAASGVGTNTDVHTYEPAKTIGCNGTLNPATGETVVIEGSLDAAATEASFFGLCYFQGANEPPKTILASLYWMRVRRIGASASNAPNVEVGSNDATTVQIYFQPVVPSTAGAGPSMDVSTGGELLTVAIQGGIIATGSTATGAGEIYVLEGSNDGSNWSGIVAFSQDNAGAVTIERRYNFVRVSRNLALGGQPTCFLGTSTGGAAGGGGGVLQILAGSGIAVSPGSGVGIVTVSATGGGGTATWPRDRARIYAIDPSAPDDTGLGYADMTGTTAADYKTACALAGTRAKKTNAGLAAIWPSFGADRMVVVLMKAGVYTDSPELWYNQTTGYRDQFPLVRGTVTNATAGSVAFAGDENDSRMAGLVTGAGMNSAGYDPTAGATVDTIPCQLFGGGAAGFAFGGTARPAGLRLRFDINAGQAALRGICRDVFKATDADTVIVSRNLPVAPLAGDTFYLEEFGVVLPNVVELIGADPPLVDSTKPAITSGSVGAQFVGIGNTDADFLSLFNVAARFCCVGTGNGQAVGGSLSSSDSFYEPFISFVLGAGRAGGGWRSDAGFASTFTAIDADMFIGGGSNDFDRPPALSISFGCRMEDASVFACNGPTDNYNFTGSSVPAPTIGLDVFDPLTLLVKVPEFVGIASSPLRLFGSTVELGDLDASGTAANKPGIEVAQRCNIRITGRVSGANGGANSAGMSVRDADQSSISYRQHVPTITGNGGDLQLSGGDGLATGDPHPIATWAQIANQEIYDTAGNHAFVFADADREFSHTINPSVKDALFVGAAGPAVAYSLVQTDLGNPGQVRFASAATAAGAARLVGVLVTGVTPNSACLVADLSGFRVMAFDGAFAVDDEVYLSTTIGLATVTAPTIARPLGMVVQDLGAGLGVVRCAPDFGPLTGGLTLAEQWLADWKALLPARFSMFDFSDLEIPANAQNDADAYWVLANGAARTLDHPTSVKCTANGVLGAVCVERQGSHPLTNVRSVKWQMCGAAYWQDAITIAADWRAFVLVSDPNTFADMVGFGVFADIDTNFFSFRVRDAGSGVLTAVVSTVPFSTGWHRGRMWFDNDPITPTLWGAFDDEAPIALLVNDTAHLPGGNLMQWHGAITGLVGGAGPATIYVDAVSVASDRP